MAFTYWEYQLLLVTLAWVGGFIPLWWNAYHGRAGRWSWWQSVGLALVLTPFIRMGVGAAYDLVALVQTTVSGGFVTLEPYAASAMWRKVWRHAFYYFLVPALGLLLVWRGRPRRDDLERAGLAPRESATRDTLHGFTLFFGILVAYVASMMIAYVLLRDVLVSTGDESRLWANITIPLIIALSGIAGVTEEFLFRGLLLNTLARRMRWGYAALVQAVFFGLVHSGYSTWAHVLGPFFFGLGMALVVRHLGLLPAVVLHASVNITFFAFDVADANPLAWGLIAALVGLNVYAAWVTRFGAVRTLWAAARDLGRGRGVHTPARRVPVMEGGAPDGRILIPDDTPSRVEEHERERE